MMSEAIENAIEAATKALIKAVGNMENLDREEWKKVARYTIAAYGKSLTAAGFAIGPATPPERIQLLLRNGRYFAPIETSVPRARWMLLWKRISSSGST